MMNYANLLTNRIFLPMAEPVFTVSISSVRGLLIGARSQGADAAWLDAVLRQAGIAPGLLDQAQARVTIAQFVALFNALKDRLDDECLGFLHGRAMRCGSFALMVRATLGAQTLDAALRRVSQAFALLQDDVTLASVADGAWYGMALHTRDAPDSYDNYLYALLLRGFWRLLAWLHGGQLKPQRVDFPGAKPVDPASYAQVFSTPPYFGQACAAVWFDAQALSQPLRQDVMSVQAFLRAAPGNLLGPRLTERRFSTRVRTLLHAAGANAPWPDLSTVAQQLHLSVSVVQRRLAAENTSFQKLKDELRRDLAIVQLTHGDASLTSIASNLGFTDCTAFQRAFKVWTGSTPGVYRMQSRP